MLLSNRQMPDLLFWLCLCETTLFLQSPQLAPAASGPDAAAMGEVLKWMERTATRAAGLVLLRTADPSLFQCHKPGCLICK